MAFTMLAIIFALLSNSALPAASASTGSVGMVVSNIQTNVAPAQQQPAVTQSDGNSLRVPLSAACPANSVEIASASASGYKFCVCESTYFNVGNGLCVGRAVNSNCTNKTVQPGNVYQSIEPEGQGQLVNNAYQLKVVMPMVKGRRYTNIRIGTCDSSYISTWDVLSTDSDQCLDRWRIGIQFAYLAANCGFKVTQNLSNGQYLQSFQGIFYVDYYDSFAPYDVIMQRNSTVALQVIINLQSRYSTEMNTTVSVFSNFTLGAYVASQNLVPGANTSTIGLAYTIQYPYMVQGYNTNLAVTGQMSAQVTAKVQQTDGTFASTSTTSAFPCSNPGDYLGTNRTCARTLTITLNHNGACQHVGSVVLMNVSVQCGLNVAQSDCPLSAPSKQSSIEIKLSSDNFCTPTDGGFKLSDLTTIRFLAPDPEWLQRGTNADTQQATWMYSRPIYMRMDFDGSVTIQGVTLNDVATRYWPQTQATAPAFQMRYSRTSPAFPTPPAIMFTGPARVDNAGKYSAPTGGMLGFDLIDQSFLMKHDVDAMLTGGSNPPGDVKYLLSLQATVTVAYTPPSGRRRRATVSAEWVSEAQPDNTAAVAHNNNNKKRQASGVAQNSLTGDTTVNLPDQSVIAYQDVAAATTPAADPSGSSTGNMSMGIIIGIAVGAVAVIFVVILAMFVYMRKRKQSARRKKDAKRRSVRADDGSSDDEGMGGVHVERGATVMRGLDDKHRKGLQSKGGLRDKTRTTSVMLEPTNGSSSTTVVAANSGASVSSTTVTTVASGPSRVRTKEDLVTKKGGLGGSSSTTAKPNLVVGRGESVESSSTYASARTRGSLDVEAVIVESVAAASRPRTKEELARRANTSKGGLGSSSSAGAASVPRAALDIEAVVVESATAGASRPRGKEDLGRKGKAPLSSITASSSRPTAAGSSSASQTSMGSSSNARPALEVEAVLVETVPVPDKKKGKKKKHGPIDV